MARRWLCRFVQGRLLEPRASAQWGNRTGSWSPHECGFWVRLLSEFPDDGMAPSETRKTTPIFQRTMKL